MNLARWIVLAAAYVVLVPALGFFTPPPGGVLFECGARGDLFNIRAYLATARGVKFARYFSDV